MHDLAIVVQTCTEDLPEAKNLFDSITKYNEDNLPVLVIIPNGETISIPNCTVMEDDEVFPSTLVYNKDRVQSIRLNLHKTGFAKNYIICTSNQLFIKPFRKSMFLSNSGQLYTFMKPAVIPNFKYLIDLGFTKGWLLEMPPLPRVWSVAVLEKLEEHLTEVELTTDQVIAFITVHYSVPFKDMSLYSAANYHYFTPLESDSKLFHYAEMTSQMGVEYIDDIKETSIGVSFHYDKSYYNSCVKHFID